jgi:hypothetical protein
VLPPASFTSLQSPHRPLRHLILSGRIPSIFGFTSMSGTVPILCIGRLSGSNAPMPLIAPYKPPGSGNSDTFPFAPAVWLPITFAPGAAASVLAESAIERCAIADG